MSNAVANSGEEPDETDRAIAIWRGVNNNVRHVMPKIDAELEAHDELLSTRPFSATTAYVLQNVRGYGDMVDFCTTEPYARIRALINNWYEENYGALMNADPSARAMHATTKIDITKARFKVTAPWSHHDVSEFLKDVCDVAV